MSYSREYDFSKPFFIQFQELQKKVPRISIFNQQCVNSEYTNQSYENKNCYLCSSIANSEDSAYCANVNEIKQALDSFFVNKSELGYELIDSERCYNSAFIINSDNCIDSMFLYDCKNCQNCIGAVGLRNGQYVFFGEQLSKDKFNKKRQEFILGGYEILENVKKKFLELIIKFPRKSDRLKKCVNCTGDFLTNSKNVKQGFGAFDLEDCGYITRMYACKDVYDSYGLGESQLIYETISNQTVYSVKFSNVTSDSRNCDYCDLCFNCENCFACIGLRNKQYCILNKQYTKEEYEKLVPQIIEHMNNMPYIDKQGRIYKYGEFFPPELSPFSYNETIAQEYFPLTKEQAIEQGYNWKDPEQRNINITIKSEDLPDHIKDVQDDITNQIIECQHNSQKNNTDCNEQCTQAFKIIQPELQFYRKMNLPLPRLCPNCRHYQRLKQRNPLKLWHRKCQCNGIQSENEVYQNTIAHTHGEKHCENTFETTYAPERPEIVYCEKCYQQEVM